jgi:hypothetical protein
MAVGRISGPLLKDNLLRDGVDLSFETDLLYLDVVNSRVGINTATPAYDLDVNGTTRSIYLYTTTQADLATFTVTNNTISSSSNTINFLPSGANPTVFSAKILAGQFNLNANNIQSTGTNTSINVTAQGLGGINLNSNVLVNGNLHATGNITADGNINLGSTDQSGSNADVVIFNAEIDSSIIPKQDITWDLGTNSLRWNNIYAQNVNVSNFSITTFTATSLSTTGSPALYIAGNTISSTGTNADVNLTTTGTGGVYLGNFKFKNNTITNTVANSVTNFAEPTYNFTATITPQIPALLVDATITGTTLTFSSSTGATVAVGQVISGGTVADGTYIVSGSGLTWQVNIDQTATCDTATSIEMAVTSVTTGTLAAGIYITSGAIANTMITATIAENTSLTGGGGIGTYLVTPSQTVNTSTAMTAVGAGYVKMSGTYGVVIPTGASATRPQLTYTETGMVRFNTDYQYVEVYNGIAWTSIAGNSSGVSVAQASDIALGIVLSLG